MSKRVSFGSTMDKDLMCKLKNLSVQTKVPLSKLLDASVEALLKEIERNKRSNNYQSSNRVEEEVQAYNINIGIPNTNPQD